VEGCAPDGTLTTNLDFEARRECVHDRATNTVQTTGNGISAAAELTAGVKNSEHDLNGRLSLGGVDVNRDASTIVNNANRTIGKDRYFDVVAVPSEGFINGVIDDLVDKVMQSPGTGGTDVHSGTFANGFETFENLNLACTVVAVIHGPVRF
jgi:hypothetical protein